MEVVYISLNKQFILNSNEVLKVILNKNENLDITKKLINDLLDIKVKEIFLRKGLKKEDISFLPSDGGYGIATFRIVTEDNEEFNLGIQIVDGIYAQDKMLIYAASIHVKQMLYKTHNEKVKTITINFIDDIVFPTSDFHTVMRLLDSDGERFWDKGFEIHVLELPKFEIEEIRDDEQAWLSYIKADNEELVETAKKRCDKIKKLDDELKEYWKNEEMK